MPTARKSYSLMNKKQLTCSECKSKFSASGKRADVAKFCSMACYLSSRWHESPNCPHCAKPVKGRRFCSTKCQRAYWLDREHTRVPQRRKSYWDRKIAVLKALGGKCVHCGINDIRVLDLDHIDATKKNKPAHRNYPTAIRVKLWEKEMDNLQILCANCHRIKTHATHWKTEGMF